MQRSAGDVQVLRSSTRRLLRSLDDLSDAQAGEPSRLPGWTRAELITHLARNADGTRGMLEAAARGESAAMYPGGREQRAAGIAAGRHERASVLLADVRKACDRLDEAWRALPPDAWDRTGSTASRVRTMRELVWVRWRELEVHHVDLDVGYESSDWPVPFVSGALNEIFATLEQRAAPSRPHVDASYVVTSTDHDRSWRVQLRGGDVAVADDDGDADGEARGWGCDLVAWLYGRDVRGSGISASGDLSVLRLPQWFPYE